MTSRSTTAVLLIGWRTIDAAGPGRAGALSRDTLTRNPSPALEWGHETVVTRLRRRAEDTVPGERPAHPGPAAPRCLPIDRTGQRGTSAGAGDGFISVGGRP